jgi:hypothetical protein
LHATFAAEECARHWLGERIVAGAIEREDFRPLVPPAALTGSLTESKGEVRGLLMDYLKRRY